MDYVTYRSVNDLPRAVELLGVIATTLVLMSKNGGNLLCHTWEIFNMQVLKLIKLTNYFRL